MEVMQVVRKSDRRLLTWLRLPEGSPLRIPAGVYLVPNLLDDQDAVFGRRLERKAYGVKRTYTRVDGRALLSVLQSAQCSDSDLSRLRTAIGRKKDGKLILLGKVALQALRKPDLHPPLQWCEASAIPGLPAAAPVTQVCPCPAVNRKRLLCTFFARVWGPMGCRVWLRVCDRGNEV
jgi:hypothetical protein